MPVDNEVRIFHVNIDYMTSIAAISEPTRSPRAYPGRFWRVSVMLALVFPEFEITNEDVDGLVEKIAQ